MTKLHELLARVVNAEGPSRELDALIAVHVGGGLPLGRSNNFISVSIPRPSREIAAAFFVRRESQTHYRAVRLV
jgi:hypothetical protein